MFDQFRRVANIYFLVISGLMMIGTYYTEMFVSPLDPYSTLATLVFVLMVTSLKEGYEDIQRSRADKAENVREVIVFVFSYPFQP